MKSVKPICEFLKTDKLIWPDLQAASNMPKNNPCPFPKGNYTIKNYMVDESKFGRALMGKYLTKGKLMEDGKILTQIDVVATLKL